VGVCLAFIHDSLKGTKRSDINWDQVPKSENKILLQYVSFITKTIIGEPTLDEFNCPAFPDDSPNGRITTECCELKARGLGCADIKKCLRYNEQKRFQGLHPDIDFNNINENNPKVKELLLVKKGLIILPLKTVVELNMTDSKEENLSEVR